MRRLQAIQLFLNLRRRHDPSQRTLGQIDLTIANVRVRQLAGGHFKARRQLDGPFEIGNRLLRLLLQQIRVPDVMQQLGIVRIAL
jgi:hypothetical protein